MSRDPPMTVPPIHVQMGLFGGYGEIAGMHIVAAHTRVRADGSEVFVGEHVRWNRGRQLEGPPRVRVSKVVPDDHPSLFDWTPDPSGPAGGPRLPEPIVALPTEVEVYPGAVQLALWSAPRAS